MPIPADKRQLFNQLLELNDNPTSIDITEKEPGGVGTLAVQVNAPSVSLSVSGQKMFFYQSGQCADGGLIVVCEDGIHIHLIELKSKLSTQKWDVAKAQLEGMYHNLLAIAAIAGLGAPTRVICHVAYTDDAIAAHPVLSKPIIGKDGVVFSTAAEWMSGSVTLAGIPNVAIVKHPRDNAGNAKTTINC